MQGPASLALSPSPSFSGRDNVMVLEDDLYILEFKLRDNVSGGQISGLFSFVLRPESREDLVNGTERET